MDDILKLSSVDNSSAKEMLIKKVRTFAIDKKDILMDIQL